MSTSPEAAVSTTRCVDQKTLFMRAVHRARRRSMVGPSPSEIGALQSMIRRRAELSKNRLLRMTIHLQLFWLAILVPVSG